MDDEQADAPRNPVSTEPESLLSSRTLEQIRTEELSPEKKQKHERENNEFRFCDGRTLPHE